ncbi:hypothetical protein Glove_227g91 [Diversispora epigaea]|uniref:Uncharacterized protein n=1 Tax=Diversispora epigaea TaxID=1348612 RepID=A0A397IIS6_9GLOM|nr:hypothetical protein Glove_227g91 [Diversispora epigaea]
MHQKEDLKRQIKDLQGKYPNHEIISSKILVQASITKDFKVYWNEFTKEMSQRLFFPTKTSSVTTDYTCSPNYFWPESIISKCTKLIAGTDSTALFVVGENEKRTTIKTETKQIEIKKKLKNIKFLSEINNDPDFSKDVITQVIMNIFKVNIFPSEKNLKETKSIIKKSFPDIYKLMDLQYYSNLFKKIKTKLLEKLRGMQGEIVSWVKLAIFEIFEKSQLPCIDFQSSSAEINSWKSKKKISNIYITWNVTIAQLFLNPKKLQKKLLLKPEDEELEVKETTEKKFKE